VRVEAPVSLNFVDNVVDRWVDQRWFAACDEVNSEVKRTASRGMTPRSRASALVEIYVSWAEAQRRRPVGLHIERQQARIERPRAD